MKIESVLKKAVQFSICKSEISLFRVITCSKNFREKKNRLICYNINIIFSIYLSNLNIQVVPSRNRQALPVCMDGLTSKTVYIQGVSAYSVKTATPVSKYEKCLINICPIPNDFEITRY